MDKVDDWNDVDGTHVAGDESQVWHYAATANDTKVYVGGTCLQLKTGKQVAP
ncbi:MAG: hypothetical protein Q7J48_09740 [Nocardioides sp.]|nr:hypothetical protein [Nocardioides sp.]